jgi:hypothetical protein
MSLHADYQKLEPGMKSGFLKLTVVLLIWGMFYISTDITFRTQPRKF